MLNYSRTLQNAELTTGQTAKKLFWLILASFRWPVRLPTLIQNSPNWKTKSVKKLYAIFGNYRTYLWLQSREIAKPHFFSIFICFLYRYTPSRSIRFPRAATNVSKIKGQVNDQIFSYSGTLQYSPLQNKIKKLKKKTIFACFKLTSMSSGSQLGFPFVTNIFDLKARPLKILLLGRQI